MRKPWVTYAVPPLLEGTGTGRFLVSLFTVYIRHGARRRSQHRHRKAGRP